MHNNSQKPPHHPPRPAHSNERMKKNLRDHKMVYGTAWKHANTDRHVYAALTKGFRAIDTACQPKHYNQRGVGDALELAIKNGVIKSRDDVWLQTKFTSVDGQGETKPYNPDDPLEKQVADSFEVSLNDLNTDYVDSLVLHGPLRTTEDTLTVWAAMERLVDEEKVQVLGMSNFYDVAGFKEFYEKVRIKPTILQNRFYEETGWDVNLRQFCRKSDIIYQSFWTLTGNPALLRHTVTKELAKKYQISQPAVIYRYIIERGGQPLNGTTDPVHMVEDLAMVETPMEKADVAKISTLIGDRFSL